MLSKIFSKEFLWIIIGIPFLSFLVLKPSFSLSLFGDDWEQLYFMWLEFEYRQSFHWFDIKSFLGPYNFSYSYLGIINNFFGLQPIPYFFVSYLFRVISIISIFLLVKYLTKDRLAACISSLLFIVSVAGLETTNWVFNLNTYMGISLFNFTTIFYLKLRVQKKQKIFNIIGFIILFDCSLIVASTRLHGSVPFLILIDLILLFIFEKKKINLLIILRLLIPICILLYLISVGAFGHVGSGGFIDRLKLGAQTAFDLFEKGQYLFLFYLPGIIGHITLPDSLPTTNNTSTGLISSVTVYSILLTIIVKNILKINSIQNKSKLGLKSFIFFNLLWITIVLGVYKLNPVITQNQFFSIFIGGETLLIMIYLFIILKTSFPLYSFTFIFSFLWLIAFTLIYWLFSPSVFPETTSRYLTMGGVGFAMFFGVFTSFLIKNLSPKVKGIPILVLIIWIIVNLSAGKQYWNFMTASRNANLASSIWNSLTESISNLDTENPTVFYFTADDPNILYWNVDFGFPSHMGLTYKIGDLNNTPVSVNDYPTLLQYAKNGTPLKTIHGRPIKHISLDHIYYYHLTGDKLISKTEMIREKLKEDLEKTTLLPKVDY